MNWTHAKPGDVLAEMLEARRRLDAAPPVAMGVDIHPGERTPLEDLPRADGRVFDIGGIRVESNPDVPEGEYWLRMSDGTTTRHHWDGLPATEEPARILREDGR